MKIIFNNQEGLYDMKNFTIISKFFEEDIAFYFTQKSSIAKRFRMTMGNRIVMINDGDHFKYQGDNSIESLYEFIEESKKPLIEELTEYNIDNLMDDELYNATFVAIVKKRESEEKTKRLLKKFKKDEDYNDISFTWAFQDDRSIGDQLIDLVGKKPKEFSYGILLRSKGESLEKFLLNKRLTEESVKEFLKKYRDGKLKKLLKSDSEPKFNDEAWKIWTGRSFPKNFKKAKEDIIFYFWSKGCENCPQFNKIFQRLAIRLQSKNKNLLFVKVDGANNDIEDFEFLEFPKVVFVPANNRTERDFYEVTSEETEEKLYEYLKSKSTFPWVEIPVSQTKKDAKKGEDQEENDEASKVKNDL